MSWRSSSHQVAPPVLDALARPQPAEQIEPLVQLLGPHPGIVVLAERAELRRNPAEAGAEDDAPAAEDVERRHRLGEHVWPAAGDRRDRRPDHQARRRRGDSRERDPRVGGRRTPHEGEVVRDEERLPAGCLRRLGHAHDVARIGIRPDVRDQEPGAHWPSIHGQQRLCDQSHRRHELDAQAPTDRLAWLRRELGLG